MQRTGESREPSARDGGRIPDREPLGGASRRVVVLGDLLLDVVIAPSRQLERGTDVPGRVILRQGGSAATTARWLARLGTPTTFITAVGRDPVGRALVEAMRSGGAVVHPRRVAGAPTGRVGVLVEPSGERSFVADRGAADSLTPRYVRREWFRDARVLHLPAYTLLSEPLRFAGTRAVTFARDVGASVSVDLASAGPLLSVGRDEALARLRDAAPDLLFATHGEAEAVLGHDRWDELLAVAPFVILKRGSNGALILARALPRRTLEVRPAETLPSTDSTGAGDAFDAGFLHLWVGSGVSPDAAANEQQVLLWRAAAVANEAAAQQLRSDRPELRFGRRTAANTDQR